MVQHLEDWQVMFRVRRTVLEMLRDRGYEVDESEILQTEDEFKQRLDVTNSQNFYAVRPNKEELMEVNPEDENDVKYKQEPILVVFAHEVDKIGKDAIRSMVNMMNSYTKKHSDDDSFQDCLNAILIVGGSVTAIAKKVSL